MPAVQRGQVLKLADSWAYRYRDASGRGRQRGGFRTRSEARAVLDEELRRMRLGGLYRETITLAALVIATWRSTSATRLRTASSARTFGRRHAPSETFRSSCSSLRNWRRGGPLSRRAPATGVFRSLKQVLAQAVA
jgi:hypothetical protein